MVGAYLPEFGESGSCQWRVVEHPTSLSGTSCEQNPQCTRSGKREPTLYCGATCRVSVREMHVGFWQGFGPSVTGWRRVVAAGSRSRTERRPSKLARIAMRIGTRAQPA